MQSHYLKFPSKEFQARSFASSPKLGIDWSAVLNFIGIVLAIIVGIILLVFFVIWMGGILPALAVIACFYLCVCVMSVGFLPGC